MKEIILSNLDYYIPIFIIMVGAFIMFVLLSKRIKERKKRLKEIEKVK
jgi:hypothetical protein